MSVQATDPSERGKRIAWQFSSDSAESALTSRDDFVNALGEAGLNVDAFVARVIFTELVTNVARHSPGPIRISLEVHGEEHWLHVFDSGDAFRWKPTLPDDQYASGGRGMFLVGLYVHEVIVSQPSTGGNLVRTLLRQGATIE